MNETIEEILAALPPDPEDRGVGFMVGDTPILISQCDLIHVFSHRLRPHNGGYANIRTGGKKQLFHRYLLGVTDSKIQVDHINRDKSDNRRSNLRTASLAENNRNQGLRVNNSSGYKGVSWDKAKRKWQAGIGLNGSRKALGRYNTAEAAALSYDAAARHYYGPFAVLNFPPEK